MKNIIQYFNKCKIRCFTTVLLIGIYANIISAQETSSFPGADAPCQNEELTKIPVKIEDYKSVIKSLTENLNKERAANFELLKELRLNLTLLKKKKDLPNCLLHKIKDQPIQIKYYSTSGSLLYEKSFSSAIDYSKFRENYKGKISLLLKEIKQSRDQKIALPEDFYVKIVLPDIFKISNERTPIQGFNDIDENEYIFKFTIKKGSGDIALSAKPKFIFYIILPLFFLGFIRKNYSFIVFFNFRQSRKNAVKEALIQGDLESAFANAFKIIPRSKLNELTILNSWYNRIKLDKNTGKMKSDRYQIQVNNIVNSLLVITKD